MPSKKFENKVALITGSSRGIGKSIALKLAKGGCNIVVNYVRSEVGAKAVVNEIKSLGVDAIAIKADTSRPDEIKAMFETAHHHFKRLDIFISNAAKGVFGSVTRIGTNGFDLSMATGPKALLIGAQESAKRFGHHGGVIVALSSIGNFRMLPNYSAMGTAKAGIETMVKYLALELSSKQIRVNAVSGGPIDTDALDDFKNLSDEKKLWVSKTPLGRLGTSEDISDVVVFLCSNESRWIQGQTIIADGGLTLN